MIVTKRDGEIKLKNVFKWLLNLAIIFNYVNRQICIVDLDDCFFSVCFDSVSFLLFIFINEMESVLEAATDSNKAL